jgi:hypothetical protein
MRGSAFLYTPGYFHTVQEEYNNDRRTQHMNLYIVIAVLCVVYALYYFTHKIQRANIKQIIFTQLKSESCTTASELYKRFQEYEIHISPLRLCLTLWYFTLLGHVKHRPQGWKLPQPQSAPLKLEAS